MSVNKISTIFFGTHDFGAQILQGLIDNGLFDIQLVITQPDKPVGRKQILTPPPVKVLAEKFDLKIDQPSSLKTYSLTDLQTYELGICAQYGLIIPQTVLDAPKHGIINIHTSLLPKYRGASPIQNALIDGESETGVTIMKMDAGLDTGPILAQFKIKIAEDDTYATLEQKLAKTANLGLTEAVLGYISGKIVPQPQDNNLATTCGQFSREDGKIDWSKTAKEIYNLYRGLTPWPGVWTTTDDLFFGVEKGKRIKFLEVKLSDKEVESRKLKVESDGLFVGCNNGAIEVLELQVEGSKPMDAKSFINGYLKK